MMPVVQAELTHQQQIQPKRRGRPKQPVVTGYFIGDDSTMHKEKGRKKEELGLDQYQLMSATALMRFWSLVLLVYACLDEERVRLQASWQRHVTIGETRRELQRLHRRAFLLWLQQRFREGDTPDSLFELLSA